MTIPGYRPGPIASWNVFPQIGPGPTGPLQHNPPLAIETPDVQRMGVGRLVTFRQWGFPPGHIPVELRDEPIRDWARGPDQPWGLGRETTQLDSFDRFQSPASSSEVLRPFEVQGCREVSETIIKPSGAAFELVRYTVPSACVAIIDRVPTVFRVEALDDQQMPIFAYGDLNGSRPCRDELIHPDPAVADPFTWQFRVTLTHNPGLGNVVTPLQGPILPENIPGDDLVMPWSDLRFGSDRPWGDRQDRPVLPRYRVRYWVTLFGPQDRFRVTVGARLGGYWQLAGRRGDALTAATRRIV